MADPVIPPLRVYSGIRETQKGVEVKFGYEAHFWAMSSEQDGIVSFFQYEVVDGKLERRETRVIWGVVDVWETTVPKKETVH